MKKERERERERRDVKRERERERGGMGVMEIKGSEDGGTLLMSWRLIKKAGEH